MPGRIQEENLPGSQAQGQPMNCLDCSDEWGGHPVHTMFVAFLRPEQHSALEIPWIRGDNAIKILADDRYGVVYRNIFREDSSNFDSNASHFRWQLDLFQWSLPPCFISKIETCLRRQSTLKIRHPGLQVDWERDVLVHPLPLSVCLSHQANNAILEVEVDIIFGLAPVPLEHGCIAEFLGHGGDLEIFVANLRVCEIGADPIVMFFEVAPSTVAHQVVVHNFRNIVECFSCIWVFVELVFAVVLPISEEV
jgi:hypothetical protein